MWYPNILFWSIIVTGHKFMCPRHSEAKKNKTLESGAEKCLLQDHASKWVSHAQNTPNSPEGFSKAFLKAWWGKGVVSFGKLLGAGILCSCSCPSRSGHHVPVNFQQDKCYSLFCKFFSLFKWILKSQSPENRLSCIFQVIGNILLQKVQRQND